MGYPIPTDVPVPSATIQPLGIRVAIFAMSTIIDTQLIGCFVKETGAADYTCIGGGVNLNLTLDELKAQVEAAPYNGDERKWLQVNVMNILNDQLDKYLRATFDWEKVAGSAVVLPNDEQINQMPNEVQQINFMLAKYGSIQIDNEKKTVQLYA